MNNRFASFLRLGLLFVILAGSVLQPQSPAYALATLSVTPLTWNIIGLDSNNVSVGPNHFPIGAHVCNTSLTDTAANVKSAFVFDDGLDLYTGNTYINLRQGTLAAYTSDGINLAPGACTDFYYEAEVTRNSNAYNKTRSYHITASSDAGAVTGSTPTPRELFVEHLVSQSRNAVTDVQLNGVSIPAGGTMTLAVGNTYMIKLVGYTATQGYNQLESFINFPNTIFQVLSVTSTYTAGTSPNDKLYADACGWDNVLSSPAYRSCIVSDDKSGGNVTATYQVKILQVPAAPLVNPEPLSTLLYDFSGSSYHYNSDYSVSTRYAQIIDPASAVSISKAFSPNTIPPGGTSTLTVTLTNSSSVTINGANFSDTLPILSGSQMVVATPAAYSTSGCGSAPTLSFTPVAGATSFSASGGTIAPNGSCTINLAVSVPSTPTTGTYQNTITNFKVGSSPTAGIVSNTANLTINSSAGSVGTGICGQAMAQWNFPTGFTLTSPAPYAPNTTVAAVASLGVGIITPVQGANDHTVTPVNTFSWGSNGGIDSNTTTLNFTYDDYFQFAIDTTGYTSVDLTFYAQSKPNNGPQGVAVYVGTTTKTAGSATDPGTQLYSNATVLATQNTWYPITLTNITGINSSGTTYFRMYGFNSNNISNGFDIYLDDVTYAGCGAALKPTLTKTFNTNPVVLNGTSTLSFAITNPNTSTLNGLQFTDVLPAGLTISDSGPTSVCGGSLTTTAATGTITFTGGVLAGGASCTITTPAVTATTAGPHSNVSGFISSTESGTNSTSTGSAKASLVAVLPPTIEKVFNPNPILPGQTTTLTFTVTNPNPSDTLPNVAFNDTFPTSPGNMVVAATPAASTSGCGAPTFVPAAGAASISFSGGTIAAGGTCIVKVNVTVPAVTTGGYANTSSAVTTTIGGLTRGTDTASSTLTVNPPHPSITISKQVSANASGPWSSYVSVPSGSTVYYRLVVENTGDVPLSTVTVTDPLLTLCTNAQWQASNASWPTLPVASPTQDPTATCTVSVTSAVGDHPNTATVTGVYNSINYTNADSATYVGVNPPSVVKSFSPNPIVPGGTSTLSIAVTNPAANTVALTGVSFTDTLTGMQVAATPNVTTTGCGSPTFAPAAGATTVSFSGGTVAVGGTCTISVDVTAALNGAYPNTVTVSTSNSNSSSPSTATLNVTLTADLTIAKTDNGTTYVPGAAIGYTVVATNNGPDDVTGATVTDAIPANITGATWTCSASAGATCTASGSGDINDTVTIPANSSVTYTIIGVVSSTATGNLSNGAAVTVPSDTTDPTPGNNSATDTDTPSACVSGQFASWTFTGNTTNIATGAGLFAYDTLGLNAPTWPVSQIPADNPAISFTGATNAGYSANNDYVDFAVPTNGRGAITLSLIDYRSGTGPASFVVYYSTDGSNYNALPPGTVYTIANAAWTSHTIDFSAVTGLNNNSNAHFRLYAYGGTSGLGTWRLDNVSLSGNCLADLVISKTDGATSVTAGGSTTYTIRATNNGLTSVTGAILGDPLVAGLSKTAVACSAAPGQCTVPTTPSVAQLESDTFALPTLASGQFYEITVTANLTAISGNVTNDAAITPPAGITNPGTSCVTSGGIIRSFNAGTGTCTSTDTDSVTPTITAVDDTATTPANTPVTTVVTTNDTNLGGAIDTNSVAVIVPPVTGTVICTGASCEYTPPAGFIGTVPYTYQVCLAAPNDSVCGTAIVTVTVTPTINAVDDTVAPINSASGGTTVSVIDNDTTNGVAAVIGTNVTLTPGIAPTPAAGSLTMNADGTITVAAGTTAATYTYPYTICTIPATVPATCDTANATVVVTAVTTATLTLQKTVVNDNGGTALDTDWTLTAAQGGTTISGVEGSASVTNSVVPVGTWTLSESGGPAGYTPGAWSCAGAADADPGDGLTLAASENVTCTITNDDKAPSLTLLKTVTNDNSGTALTTDWTLTATGAAGTPTNLSGTTPVASGAGFKADTYTLAEINGPAGYTASTWSCTNGVTVTAGQITLILGQSTTCTINNNDNDLLPVANPDTNSAIEGGLAVNGNVRDGGVAAGDFADNQGDPTATVTAADQGGTDITIGTAFTTSAGGTLTLNASGTYSYTPPATLAEGSVLTEIFNYTITDNDGDVSSTTLTITVDRLPQANPDTNTATEGGAAVTGNTITNDDEGNTNANVTSASQGGTLITIGTAFNTAAGGTLTLNADGSYSYTPPALGSVLPGGLTEIFDYTITDANGDTSTSTLTITVNDVDRFPQANPDTNAAVENGPAVNGNVRDGGVSAGDAADTQGDPTATVTAADQGGTAITIGIAFTTANGGSLTLNADGTYSYTPPLWNLVPAGGLTEVFNYTITDADGDPSSSTLTITVADGSRAPTATDNESVVSAAAPTHTDNMMTGNEGNGVDSDPDGDPLTVTEIDGMTDPSVDIAGTFGTLNWASDGSYTYTLDTTDPDFLALAAGSTATETFTYTINDGTGGIDTAQIIITIVAQGSPTALTKTVIDSNQAFTTNPNAAIGEIVTYQVTVNVPPGTFTNAQLVDTMNRGLSFMDCTGITDNGLTTSVAGSFSAVCSTPAVDDAGGGTTVDIGRRVTFDFGTLTNGAAADKSLVITYRAVILDSAANVNGTNLHNSAQWTWGGGSTLGPAATTLTVAEPVLSISKTSNTTLVAVGSEIIFNLTIQHTGSSRTNAYDAVVTDVLPAAMELVPGTLDCAAGTQPASTCTYNAGTTTVSATWNNFALGGGNGQVTFRARILALPPGGITNVGNVAWTSLPGNVSAPQNINIFSTDRDYDPASQVDVYGVSDTLKLGVFTSTIPATGFAPNVITNLSNTPRETYFTTGDIAVEVPSLGITMPIVGVPLKNGAWNVSWLGSQAGWLEGSAFPSHNGNSVLTGHVYLSNGLPGPFVNLGKLKYGDKVIVHAYGQRYVFEVRTNTVVDPNDASVFKHEEKSWLTLVTCKEYDEKTNTYKKRVVVRAVLVKVEAELP